MKIIYSARDPIEANLLKAFLEGEGVCASVQGERVFELQGALPVIGPTVWVSDGDEPAALDVLKRFLNSRTPPARPDWRCITCGEVIPGNFTECWKCVNETDPPRPVDRRVVQLVLLIVFIIAALLLGMIVRNSGSYSRIPPPAAR